MTPQTFVVVLLLLVVKYTLELADRTGSRRRLRLRRPRMAATAPLVIDFGAAAANPAKPVATEATGDPFWDLVTARIAAAEADPDVADD